MKYYELEINAYALVTDEREKQKVIGFDAVHDDTHINGELASLAAFFIVPGPVRLSDSVSLHPTGLLPQGWDGWEPNKVQHSTGYDINDKDAIKSRIHDLVKGAACSIAEIQRLQRVAGVVDPEALEGFICQA